METSTKSAVDSARVFTPNAGQTDADVAAWFKLKYPEGVTEKSSRAYTTELYKSRPRQAEDLKGYNAWYSDLTDRQRGIMADAKRRSDADPVNIAKRKARRDADPYYQKQLKKQRQEYSDEITTKENRKVRSYRRNENLTDEEKKDRARAERRERNDKLREHIRDELAAGRNPFDQKKFDDMNSDDDKEARHSAKWSLCDGLLKSDGFDTINDPRIVELAELHDLSIEDAHRLIRGAVEVLRTAKAIRKNGDTLRLRGDLANQEQGEGEQADLEALPNYGMF